MPVIKPCAATAAAILASAGLLAACDKSPQSGDGATAAHDPGTSAYTPDGKPVQTGASDAGLNAPEQTINPSAPAATGSDDKSGGAAGGGGASGGGSAPAQ